MKNILSLFVVSMSCVTLTGAQDVINPEWDGFQRSQESVQDNDSYFAQNGRQDLSLFTRTEETRVGVFSFDLSSVSTDVGVVELRLFNVTTADLIQSDLNLYVKQHDLESEVSPTWSKLDLSTSLGDLVVSATITDNDRNSWMIFSSSELNQKVQEAKTAGNKLAFVLSYPATEALKFHNSNSTNKPILSYGGDPISVSGIRLENSPEAIVVGSVYSLTSIIIPENATNQNVNWSSSNENVATVEDGMLRGISDGAATISVTTEDGGFSDLFVVSVVESDSNEKNIKPGTVWNDVEGKRINAHGGCVIFHEGKYYWYGTEKEEGLSEAEHADAGVSCYTSTDLINWEDQGMVLTLSKENPTGLLGFESNFDRPKVVYNEQTQEFVLFFKYYPPGEGLAVAYVGVATSDTPTGKFQFLHTFLGADSPNGSGDFAMFKDNDGSLYHLTVRKPDKAFVVGKMRDDYLLPEGEYEICEGVTSKTEAPAVFKRNGKYHMLASESSGWAPNAARYFSSSSLGGPWEYHGNPTNGVNPFNGLGPDLTFGGQSAFVIEGEGVDDGFIAFFDINKPEHPFESLYVWLPIDFDEPGIASITWNDSWNLDYFGPSTVLASNPVTSTIQIFPIPTTELIHISGLIEGNYQLLLHDMQGGEIMNQFIQYQNDHTLELPMLKPGIYLLNVSGSKGSVRRKIIVE